MTNVRSEPLYSVVPSEKNALLISEVKKCPALYDTSNPNYYILAQRNKAWLQVASNCNIPAAHCHLRWKSLRKRYAKEKRKLREVLDGQRRPWALYPKMVFLQAASVRGGRVKSFRKRNIVKKKSGPTNPENFKQTISDDDMLILDDNDEIVRTCKTTSLGQDGEYSKTTSMGEEGEYSKNTTMGEEDEYSKNTAMGEEDEYIYEYLDDPDSALEIMKKKPNPIEKQTAIRSNTSTFVPTTTRVRGSGRIRKLTPKMQNSVIAKKLKHAQQILQQSSLADKNKPRTQPKSQDSNNTQVFENKTNSNQFQPNNLNIVRTEQEQSPSTPNQSSVPVSAAKKEPCSLDKTRSVKVIKLKGRNPIIFPPEELPKFQSYLKAESSLTKAQNETCPPLIKVKSVENLNNNGNNSSLSSSNDNRENGNLDIIHSVGLVRKGALDGSPPVENANYPYSRSYSWNVKKSNKKSDTGITQKTQADSQTRDYEIEETWNDIIKEEMIDGEYWQYEENQDQQNQEDWIQSSTNEYDDGSNERADTWTKLSQAKLDLVSFQQKLLEEQHKKTLEYMKKEHELKMVLLRAEIDLKRKQLNIML